MLYYEEAHLRVRTSSGSFVATFPKGEGCI